MRIVTLVMVLTLSGAAAAAAPDPALKTFIAGFSAALGRGDLAAATEMTHFPLQNEVYQEGQTISRAEFKAHFKASKEAGFAACLKKNAPKAADKDSRRLGDERVDCEGNIFYFKKYDGQWRYSGFENVNE